jgi:DnaK suppressor protein
VSDSERSARQRIVALDHWEAMMPNEITQVTRFSPEYLDRKRRQLVQLQKQLRQTSDAAKAEEVSLQGDAVSEVREYEEEGQRLDQIERERNLFGRDIARLSRLKRALQKIDEGTYGLSDVSGEPIPEERLEAMPDAINTLAEQSRIEVSDAT